MSVKANSGDSAFGYFMTGTEIEVPKRQSEIFTCVRLY